MHFLTQFTKRRKVTFKKTDYTGEKTGEFVLPKNMALQKYGTFAPKTKKAKLERKLKLFRCKFKVLTVTAQVATAWFWGDGLM
jgi:hypothetical protein